MAKARTSRRRKTSARRRTTGHRTRSNGAAAAAKAQGLYTIAMAAKALKLSQSRVGQLAKDVKPAGKHGNSKLFRLSDLKSARTNGNGNGQGLRRTTATARRQTVRGEIIKRRGGDRLDKELDTVLLLSHSSEFTHLPRPKQKKMVKELIAVN